MKIMKMYDLVFEDIVKGYIDMLNYEEEKVNLSEEEIKEIVHKLIYKNEYVWEIINETINVYIEDIINKRKKSEE